MRLDLRRRVIAGAYDANVHGGATGIGELPGASGARLMTTPLSALEQHGGPFGLQTMCAAGGTASTAITERPDGPRP
jgi:acetyl-CoA acyltransferase